MRFKSLLLVALLFSVTFGCEAINTQLNGEPVPVECSSRDAWTSSGKVVIIKNVSPSTLKFKLSSDGQSQAFVLAPNELKEFGPLENWQFASGTKYQIRSTGFMTNNYSVH